MKFVLSFASVFVVFVAMSVYVLHRNFRPDTAIGAAVVLSEVLHNPMFWVLSLAAFGFTYYAMT